MIIQKQYIPGSVISALALRRRGSVDVPSEGYCYCGCGGAIPLPRSAGAPAAGVVPGGSAVRRLMISSILVAVSFKVSVSSVVMAASVILLVSFRCKVSHSLSTCDWLSVCWPQGSVDSDGQMTGNLFSTGQMQTVFQILCPRWTVARLTTLRLDSRQMPPCKH